MQNIYDNQELIQVLQNGGVVVMPTDTIYGILTTALNMASVERLYAVRRRSPEKPCIILISEIAEIEKFGISLEEGERKILGEFSALERPTSFILDCDNIAFEYLHRGTKTLSFRIPKNEELKELLKQTGPLIAPSANFEGETPAENIEQARLYFGELVDMYIDGGEISGSPSRIVRLYKDGTTTIIRE
ncbi:MAG: L-threonylcarbamoyladenylate synthase [Candidatus Paceibacterota bacterium]